MTQPSYKTHDPKGWGGDPKRGAALGRISILNAPDDFDGKVTLRRIRLDGGGYDSNGTYFGHGNRPYWVADENGDIDFMLRAVSRDEAKRQVLKKYPKARFYDGPPRS